MLIGQCIVNQQHESLLSSTTTEGRFTVSVDKEKLKSAKSLALKATKEERKMLEKVQTFELQNKQFANFLKQQREMERKVKEMWDAVKVALVEANYTDVIENENFRISISKVSGIKVTDIDAVPREFKEKVWIPKTDEIKKHVELYDKVPEGVKDNSYFRLNKKVK